MVLEIDLFLDPRGPSMSLAEVRMPKGLTPHPFPTNRAKVTIIGAGPGGLAAALLLARAGLQVEIVERLPRVGGRCSSLEISGFRFDLGPTFFLHPGVLARIFRLIGRDLFADIPMVRLDPQYRISFGAGGYIDATPDLHRLEAEVARISSDDAPQVRRFLEDNRSKFAAFRSCLEMPFMSWWDVLRWRMVKLLPWLQPWKSLDRLLQNYFVDPRLRLAFSFQSKYLGMSPFQCPSLFSILSFLEYEYGVWHPLGGCSAVSEAMARIAQDMGVVFHLGETVTELILKGRRVVGVRTNRCEIASDAVVLNADFAHAITRIVPDRLRRRWSNQRIERKKFSCSTFMLYLGIKGQYSHLPHHTIHCASDYVRNLEDIEQRHILSEEPSFYVQNACVTDPSLAPPGYSTLYVLVPVSHQHPNIDWSREAQPFRARVLQELKKIGLFDLEQRIVVEKMVTPADWEQEYAIYRGATFNLAHTWSQMLHLRPHNRFEELDGLYLVGGGTHPGSGLPVIYESARISTRLLLQDLGLESSWLGVPGADDETSLPIPHTPRGEYQPSALFPSVYASDHQELSPTANSNTLLLPQ
jgi:phytoene desaturase